VELGKFEELIQKYKALCYKDICFWIVKNLKAGDRDILAMEVHLWHYKGVDKKLKPYASTSLFSCNPSAKLSTRHLNVKNCYG
jgi:hypothetical protein